MKMGDSQFIMSTLGTEVSLDVLMRGKLRASTLHRYKESY
jgi:hypothetical protein